MVNLIGKCVNLTALLNGCLPISLASFQPPYSLRHKDIEIRPIKNPTMIPKCSSERKSHKFLTLSQKLEMIKLSEEGLSKSETGLELGLLCQS